MESQNLNLSVGDDIPYKWPKINGVMTYKTEEELVNHIKENQYWIVTEKLHGYNCSVSSKGWIGSRNKIIGLRNDPDLLSTKFQGLSLEHVASIFPKLDQFYKKIQKDFYPNTPFELVLYGEMMGPGTATGRLDIYNYRKKGYQIGHMYVFGLGFIFEGKEFYSPFFFFGNVFKHENVYIVPLDKFVKTLLTSCDIDTVELWHPQLLQNIFTHEYFVNQLIERTSEGFVLSHILGKGFIKWKYPTHKTNFQNQHLKRLENFALFNKEKKCVENFKKIYNNIDCSDSESDIELF